MIGVLGQDSALVRLHWANNVMNFIMKYALGAGFISQPVDQ